MNLRYVSTVALACAAVVVSGCVRVTDGRSVADGWSEPPASAPATSSTSAANQPEPGIMPTSEAPVPAGPVTCAPEVVPRVGYVAAVDDPRAPQIVIGVPEGWSFTGGTGDVAGTLTGPEQMTATVTIATTDLDPAAAFRGYADDNMEQSAVSAVSVLPGELCEFSGQKLMGSWSDIPGTAVEFRDRIVHLPTDTANYLVSVHVEAPSGADAFDAAGDVLTADFEVRMP
ncbi:hypothetical protein [Mycolicibacterium lacusdiani]|uniref:hypothetical protein n=1 Tax=Mycolicibacterium lacusdiani TaxID=2895283 RepID=UPI001F3D23E0|nr:hypothetical protein [Mycolicibacterium lacusdiani]